MVINKENCNHSLTWNYNTWSKISFMVNPKQNDWNQTLMTKMNILRNMIKRFYLLDTPGLITISENLRPLINTLEYYNEDEIKFILGKKYNYKVKFTDEHENLIFFTYLDYELKVIPVFSYPENKSMGKIELKLIDDFSELEINEYKKNLMGYIEILNYE